MALLRHLLYQRKSSAAAVSNRPRLLAISLALVIAAFLFSYWKERFRDTRSSDGLSRLSAFIHTVQPRVVAPAGCRATVRGKSILPGTRPPFDRMLIVTVETRLSRIRNGDNIACDALKSWAYGGAKLLVLGDENITNHRIQWRPGYEPWPFTEKMRLLRDFLSSHESLFTALGDDALASTALVFTDGSDTVFQNMLGPEALLDCLNRHWCEHGWDSAYDVLAAGERDLWPWKFDVYNEGMYPGSKEDDFRFLNAGNTAGSVGAMLDFMRDGMDIAQEREWTDDQAVYQVMMLLNNKWKTRLHPEANCQRCWGTLHWSYGAESWKRDRYVWDPRLARWFHNATGCIPAMAHYNGPEPKRDFPGYMAQMESNKLTWYHPRLSLSQGAIWFYNVSLAESPPAISMAELCTVGVPGVTRPASEWAP